MAYYVAIYALVVQAAQEILPVMEQAEQALSRPLWFDHHGAMQETAFHRP